MNTMDFLKLLEKIAHSPCFEASKIILEAPNEVQHVFLHNDSDAIRAAYSKEKNYPNENHITFLSELILW